MSEQRTKDERAMHLLAEARWYVSTFEPASFDEGYNRDMLLGEIDEILPKPEPIEYCNARMPNDLVCVLRKGHEGAHDEIPF